jgi:hypothetical protein
MGVRLQVLDVLGVISINELEIGFTYDSPASYTVTVDGIITANEESSISCPSAGLPNGVPGFIGCILGTLSPRVFVSWEASDMGTDDASSLLQAGFGSEVTCLDGPDDDCKLALDDNTDGGGMSMFASVDNEGTVVAGLSVGLKVKMSHGEHLHFVGVVSYETPSIAVELAMIGYWQHAFGIRKLHFGDAILGFSLVPVVPIVVDSFLIGATVLLGEANILDCPGYPNYDADSSRCIQLSAYTGSGDEAFALVYGDQGPSLTLILSLFLPAKTMNLLSSVSEVVEFLTPDLLVRAASSMY